MKWKIVEVRNGEKVVHWGRFAVMAILLIVAGAALGELVAYLAMGRLGKAAPVAGAIVGLLIGVRKLFEVLAYQPTRGDDAVLAP